MYLDNQRGYTCGQCPPDLQGDGQHCYDEVEMGPCASNPCALGVQCFKVFIIKICKLRNLDSCRQFILLLVEIPIVDFLNALHM